MEDKTTGGHFKSFRDVGIFLRKLVSVPLLEDNWYVPRLVLFSCPASSQGQCDENRLVSFRRKRLYKEWLHFWPKANWKLEQWTQRDLHYHSLSAPLSWNKMHRGTINASPIKQCVVHRSYQNTDEIWRSARGPKDRWTTGKSGLAHIHSCVGHSHLFVSLQSRYYVVWHRQVAFYFFQLKE